MVSIVSLYRPMDSRVPWSVAFCALASVAQAQQPCGPRAEMEKLLRVDHGEVIVGAGISPTGVLYVLANAQSGSFTILLLRADNVACIVGGGTGWTSVPVEIPGENL